MLSARNFQPIINYYFLDAFANRKIGSSMDLYSRHHYIFRRPKENKLQPSLCYQLFVFVFFFLENNRRDMFFVLFLISRIFHDVLLFTCLYTPTRVCRTTNIAFQS